MTNRSVAAQLSKHLVYAVEQMVVVKALSPETAAVMEQSLNDKGEVPLDGEVVEKPEGCSVHSLDRSLSQPHDLTATRVFALCKRP